jgi:hypothetical protein
MLDRAHSLCDHLLHAEWSARELATERRADDSNLTRSKALRLAMMALADGPGYLDARGLYAHSLCDGGVR